MNKKYTVYHWDTFDNSTIKMAEKDTLEQAMEFVNEHYDGRISDSGADRVDIVHEGRVVEWYKVR